MAGASSFEIIDRRLTCRLPRPLWIRLARAPDVSKISCGTSRVYPPDDMLPGLPILTGAGIILHWYVDAVHLISRPALTRIVADVISATVTTEDQWREGTHLKTDEHDHEAK